VTEDDYKLGCWRAFNKNKMPPEDAMDSLHDAVIAWYETNGPSESPKISNWLSRVAWHKWIDFKRKWSTRKVLPIEEMNSFSSNKNSIEAFELKTDIENQISLLPEGRRKIALLWYMGLNCRESGQVLGISTQAVHQSRLKLKGVLRDGLSAYRK
jgi:RNA polymerase sigma factor (sigma-70 family)